MKFSHLVLLFAFVGSASARAAPAHLVAPMADAPTLQMQISEAFLSEATASLDATGAHKLPYSNPSTGECQKDTHFGASAEGQCVLETPGHNQPSQCALICKPGAGGCPRGASCQPTQGLGICTYPAGPRGEELEVTEEDN